MKEPASDELIRAYLKGRLEHPALAQFEQQLQTDAELLRTLALHRAEMAASELMIAADTREWFKTWQHETSSRAEPGKKNLFTWLTVSALLLLLLFVAIWVYQGPQKQPPAQRQELRTSPEAPPKTPAVPISSPPVARITPPKPAPQLPDRKTYMALATSSLPDPVRSTLRQLGADTVLSPFRKAQRAFAAADYPQTLDLLTQTDSTQRQSTAFLAAHALFRLHRFSEAEIRFAALVRENSRQYKFQSEWGLLMCHLARFPQQENAFREQLNAILQQKDHPFFNQAKALHEKLGD